MPTGNNKASILDRHMPFVNGVNSSLAPLLFMNGISYSQMDMPVTNTMPFAKGLICGWARTRHMFGVTQLAENPSPCV
jgi:hypothetical protein